MSLHGKKGLSKKDFKKKVTLWQDFGTLKKIWTHYVAAIWKVIWWPPDGRIFGGHQVEKSSGEGCEGIY